MNHGAWSMEQRRRYDTTVAELPDCLKRDAPNHHNYSHCGHDCMITTIRAFCIGQCKLRNRGSEAARLILGSRNGEQEGPLLTCNWGLNIVTSRMSRSF